MFFVSAYLGPKKATVDGFEMCFGMTFLGHFYLTYLLINKLKKYAPSRVINVLSDSYKKGKIDFEDLAMMKGYDMFGAYARSKLAQAIFTVELHRRYFAEVVQTFAVHPGKWRHQTFE